MKNVLLKKIFFSSFIFFGFIFACTYNPKKNERPEGHKRLYSHPQKPHLEKLSPTEKRVVLMVTAGLKGSFEAQQKVAKDEYSPASLIYPLGGAPVFSSYLKKVREIWGPKLVLIDSGGFMSDSSIMKISKGKIAFDFFEYHQYDFVTLSHEDIFYSREINPQLSHFKDWVNQIFLNNTVNIVNTSLLDLKKNVSFEDRHFKGTFLKDIEGLKVGFIGLTLGKGWEKISPDYLTGFYFQSDVAAIVRGVQLLRQTGAQMIVAVGHEGIDCSSKIAEQKKLPLNKVNFDPLDSSPCQTENGLGQLLHILPPGTIDVMVTGGKGKVANFINNIPVIAPFEEGSSFSLIDLVWDSRERKLNTKKTFPYQPIFVCHKFFAETEDCYGDDASVDHRKLIPVEFFGAPLEPTEDADWLQEWRSAKTENPLWQNKIKQKAAVL
jgi:2',3'-cyclic-nucleotide 2'-phosphodiesterase (5'-nucleotidase family)